MPYFSTWGAATLVAGALLTGALLAPVIGRAQQVATPTPNPTAEERHRQDDERLRKDWPNLARYAAANKKLPAPTPGRPRVALMGNSITDGWPGADSAFFANKTYELVGRGISGQTSSQMLVRFWADIIALKPAATAILAGVNDIAENNGPYDEEATMHNIMAMAELAHNHGIKVIMCSVLPAYDFPWRPGMHPAPKVMALNKRIKAYADQQHFVYLDYHSAMADARQGLPPAYARDEVHPTLAGYRVMEPLLLQAVARALKSK
jgi:lysophospholipase L1-like esterase